MTEIARSGSFVTRVLAGENHGVLARLWRSAMLLPMLGYSLGNGMRQALFDWRLRTPATLQVPVVSIGNLSAGGTGKTPAVIWLVRELTSWSLDGPVAVLSRGYRAAPGAHNDEAVLLARELPGVRHEQHPHRATAGRTALQADPGIAVLVLDDGFSHRQLARDVNLVLVDATRPFGFFELLPRGLFREPPAALRRADAVILTRADQLPAADLARLRARIQRYLRADAPLATATHQPVGLRTPAGTVDDRQPLDTLRDAPVFLASGVGNPTAVERTLTTAGARLVGHLRFPDHHHWSATDVTTVTTRARAAGAARVIITAKDAVKVAPLLPAEDTETDDPSWLVLEVEFRLADDEAATRLLEVVRAAVRPATAP